MCRTEQEKVKRTIKVRQKTFKVHFISGYVPFVPATIPQAYSGRQTRKNGKQTVVNLTVPRIFRAFTGIKTSFCSCGLCGGQLRALQPAVAPPRVHNCKTRFYHKHNDILYGLKERKQRYMPVFAFGFSGRDMGCTGFITGTYRFYYSGE